MDVDKIVKDCLETFPNANGDPIVALALMVSSLQYARYERNDLLEVNARQAQMLGKQYLIKDQLLTELNKK